MRKLRFLGASLRGRKSFPGEETVSPFFSSLSSLISPPHLIFAYVAGELMEIETTFITALGLPLELHLL
jgi:hypothetical protein